MLMLGGDAPEYPSRIRLRRRRPGHAEYAGVVRLVSPQVAVSLLGLGALVLVLPQKRGSATRPEPSTVNAQSQDEAQIVWPTWASPDEYTLWDSEGINRRSDLSQMMRGAPEYPMFFNPWGKKWLVRRHDGSFHAFDPVPTAPLEGHAFTR